VGSVDDGGESFESISSSPDSDEDEPVKVVVSDFIPVIRYFYSPKLSLNLFEGQEHRKASQREENNCPR
jgi:hypothetical protein